MLLVLLQSVKCVTIALNNMSIEKSIVYVSRIMNADIIMISKKEKR